MSVFMERRRFCLALACAATAALPTAQAQGPKDAKKEPPPLVARCERDSAIYAVGEKAKFLITGTISGEAVYRLSNDGVGVIREGKIQFKPGMGYSLTESLAQPGFLQLRVEQGKNRALAAAAFDPTK